MMIASGGCGPLFRFLEAILISRFLLFQNTFFLSNKNFVS